MPSFRLHQEKRVMTRTTARLGRLAGALTVGILVLTGCAENSSDAAHHGATTGNSDASAGAEVTVNDADVTFAQKMIPHHQQAIEMAQLTEGRAADPRIFDLAGRIQAAQQPEIDTLTRWLADGAADTGGADHGGTDHGNGMAGVMSEQDMQALMNARAAEFDRLFLEQMIVHHTGAVEMAMTESVDGENTDALAMAESIRDTQNAEIAEMQQLLNELGG
jgi:uncharacterized protein (DUF305 family)